jgi:hypothetical protein
MKLLSSVLRHRARGFLVIAFAMLVTTLAPVTPAHATYGPDQTVGLTVNSNAGPSLMLARLEGTIAFDDGNTKFRYNLRLCWGSGAYPQPNLRVTINNGSIGVPLIGAGGAPAPPGCQTVSVYAGEYIASTIITNVTFTLTAGWFYPGNQYNSRTKSVTYDNPYN